MALNSDHMEISAIFFMLLLGLRHGFDPDHIAIIDGVSMRYADSKPRLAAWTGTLFALGHGAVITAVAVLISLFDHSLRLPTAVWNLLNWVPGLLLIMVGLVNLRSLLSPGLFRPIAIRSALLPGRLKRSSHPLAIVLMGVLFALVFDSTTQAAAWTYTATSRISTASALGLGLSFSAGMILTDTTDSRVLSMLVRCSVERGGVVSYRRKLGWIIVAISLLAGLYKVATLLDDRLQLSDNVLSAVGVIFFVTMAGFYSWALIGRKSALKNV
jgi:high-affinity nickel-transport protein